MRSLLPLLLSATVALAPTTAQVTGVAGINDYTINGLTPGSRSCTSLCIPGPTQLTMSVATVPGNLVLVFWTACPCRPCVFPWLPNSCQPSIPPALSPPCFGLTNQSIDLQLTSPNCPIIHTTTMIANAAGIALATLPVPGFGTGPCSTAFSSQAVVLDTCGIGGFPPAPGPFVLTQSYTVNI